MEIEGLAELVQKQRRLLAGQLRITREERALREQMAKLLEHAGVKQIACNGFDVRHVDRAAGNYVTVTPIPS